jgi:hypothetical protein
VRSDLTRWGVKADRVRAWIDAGELRAVDLAQRKSRAKK